MLYLIKNAQDCVAMTVLYTSVAAQVPVVLASFETVIHWITYHVTCVDTKFMTLAIALRYALTVKIVTTKILQVMN